MLPSMSTNLRNFGTACMQHAWSPLLGGRRGVVRAQRIPGAGGGSGSGAGSGNGGGGGRGGRKVSATGDSGGSGGSGSSGGDGGGLWGAYNRALARSPVS